MARPLEAYDNIAIAEVVIFTFYLLGGVYLCFKHGISRSAGWRFLVIFALVRIIGSGLRLGTISDPKNQDLYIGWMTLNGFALGPLILILLGLLGRAFDSISRQGQVVVKPMYQRFIQILMLVGVILIIVGCTKSDFTFKNGSPKISYPTIAKVGMVLLIVVFVLVCGTALLAFLNQGFVAQGEHRILVAVAVSLPFLLVRIVYSCLIILGGISGSVWLSLGAGIIMEMIIVLVCEAVGFSLGKKVSDAQEGYGYRAAS